jgi:hypothetical protein
MCDCREDHERALREEEHCPACPLRRHRQFKQLTTVTAIAFSEDGGTLISARNCGELIAWDTATGAFRAAHFLKHARPLALAHVADSDGAERNLAFAMGGHDRLGARSLVRLADRALVEMVLRLARPQERPAPASLGATRVLPPGVM